MKRKLLTLHVALIVLGTSLFLIHQLSSSGRAPSVLLHHGLYPVLQRFHVLMSDLKMRWRGPQKPRHPIAVVEIDGDALERLGRWPWRRDYLARLIENAFLAGAKVVGLDIVFSEPQPPAPEALEEELKRRKLGKLLEAFDFDGQMAEMVEAYRDKLVLAWVSESPCQPRFFPASDCPVGDPDRVRALPRSLESFIFGRVKFDPKFRADRTPLLSAPTVVPNIERIASKARYAGFANSTPDPDGVVRRASLVMMAGGHPHPALSLQVAALTAAEPLSLEIGPNGSLKRLSLAKSDRTLPVTSGGAVTINFRGPRGTFPSVSALDLLEAFGDDGKPTGKNAVGALKGASVLIGISALAVADIVPIPFDPSIPGVEVNANLVDNALSGDFLSDGQGGPIFWLVLLLMTVGAWVISHYGQRLPGRQVVLGFSGLMLFLFGLDFEVLYKRNYDVCTVFLYGEWFSVIASAMFAKYLREEKSKQFLHQAFSRYVSPLVVDAIMADPDALELGGKKQPITVLFSDLRGFTSFAERVEGRVLMQFLNEYFDLMMNVLFAHQGTLDKFIGDAVMAFWGAPLPQPDHPLRACRAAIEMAKIIAQNRDRFQAAYGIQLKAGFGLHTSLATVGNLGSKKNVNFTAIGAGVNLASRLQTATKTVGADVLTTIETLEAIRATGAEPPLHRELGMLRVKGKIEAIQVVELMTRPVSALELNAFSDALAALKAGEWSTARRLLRNAGGEADPVCRILLERSKQMSARTGSVGWDGTWSLAA